MRSVLLLESHADSRDAFATYLRAEGFHVTIVLTSDEAQEQALSRDALVTCLHPEGQLDALGLVRWVRLQPTGATKAIIVVSASAHQSDAMAAQGADCDVFLPKPCLPGDLAAELRHTIARRIRHERRPARAALPKRRETA
jgi:two-component system OmpR family response regulator/two-component system response regulator CpxR